MLLLFGMSAASWSTRAAVEKAQKDVVLQQSIDAALIELRLQVINAETGQRGFLITGETEYLEPYDQAQVKKDERTADLIEKLGKDPEIEGQLTLLFQLIQARDRELDEAIAIRREASLEATIAFVRADTAKQLTDQIREKIEVIRGIIHERYERAEGQLQSTLIRSTLVMNGSAAVALASALVGLSLLLGHLKSRAESLELERDKKRAERSDYEKSRFLASMSHEIRTPLNAMLGFTELLEDETTSAKGRKYLKAVRDSGESLVLLINDVLDLSKIESGILELDYDSVKIRDLAQTVSLLFSQQALSRGVDFRVTVHDDCPAFMLLDTLRLRQILVNLIGNALKFTQAGFVRLDVKVSNIHARRCNLIFEVSDSGRGIAENKQKEIFKPFKQARSEDELLGGTGLGLSISRELATLMGGEVKVESVEGVGTTFSVTMPGVEIVDGTKPLTDVHGPVENFNLLRASSILIVDDNPLNRELLAGYFEGSHHQLHFAANGREAIEQAQRIVPDVVLMDIRMPVMGGQEARSIMKDDQALQAVPVIAVTASSLLRQENILRKKFDGYIRKPFSRAELFSALDQVVRRVDAAAGDEEKPATESTGGEDTAAAAPDGIVAADPQAQSRAVALVSEPETLLRELAELKDRRWEQLTQVMAMSDVADFAATLQSLGEKHDYSPLIRYAEAVREYSENFEQAKLEKSLNDFDSVIGSIPTSPSGEADKP